MHALELQAPNSPKQFPHTQGSRAHRLLLSVRGVRRLNADNAQNRSNNKLLGTSHDNAANSRVLVLCVEIVQVYLTLESHYSNDVVIKVCGCAAEDD